MRMKSAAGALDEALSRSVEVKGVRLVTLRADSLERGQLRTLVDNLKQKLGEGVVVLASAQPEGKVALIAGVTPGLTKRIQAGKLVGAVAKTCGRVGRRQAGDCRRPAARIRPRLTRRSRRLRELLGSCWPELMVKMAKPENDESTTVRLRRELLEWYARNRRDLPWRRNADPYAGAGCAGDVERAGLLSSRAHAAQGRSVCGQPP
jgi:hypothetical protein